jgi:hypothetical protein
VRTLLALALVATTACGASLPGVWEKVRRGLPADTERVLYADVGALAQSKLGAWVLAKAGERLAPGCRFDRGELVWVRAERGHTALFVREVGAPGEAGGAGALVGCFGGLRVIGLAPGVWALARDPGDIAALTAGAGALGRDRAFAEGLVNVDGDAAVWMVARSERGGKDGALGVVTLNVFVRRTGVEAVLRVPLGSWAKAVAAAFALEREARRWDDRFAAIDAGAEGSDLVVNAWILEPQLERAMEELWR